MKNYRRGVAPLGYKWVWNVSKGNKLEKKLEVDHETAGVVKLIFDRYAQLKSLLKLSKLLTKLGKKTINNNNFNKETLAKILRNPIYKGFVKDVNGDLKIDAELIIIPDHIYDECRRIAVNNYKRKFDD